MELIAAAALPDKVFDILFQEFASEQAGHRCVVLNELKLDIKRLPHKILYPPEAKRRPEPRDMHPEIYRWARYRWSVA